MLTFPTLITGTITGLRISSVNGTAFLDNCPALIPYADGNHRIEIYDASGRILQGYLKAQGAGETTNTTYTANFSAGLDGWSADFGSGYGGSGSFVWDTDHVILSVTAPTGFAGRPTIARTGVGGSTGGLYYTETDYTVVSGTVVLKLELILSSSVTVDETFAGTDTYSSTYATSSGTYYNRVMYYFNGAHYTFVLNITGVRVKQITAPTTDGVTVVSTKGGATQNFTSKDASFTYNAASYRYAIYDTLKVSRPTRYMGVSTHNI
jgi:hypothetical protein